MCTLQRCLFFVIQMHYIGLDYLNATMGIDKALRHSAI